MTDPHPEEVARPPLGSWPRFYVLVCGVAVLYIVLLYWFTQAWNQPLGGA